MNRKKRKREADQALLDALFKVEAEWKKVSLMAERSYEPFFETEQMRKNLEAQYGFLLREVKHRKLTVLQY
ncbi:MAG TPA: DUF2508 family protein [Pseudogracilibacillus sp.]|nr:DUF2508 family protein [Pseudogracilibacillus sp.]